MAAAATLAGASEEPVPIRLAAEGRESPLIVVGSEATPAEREAGRTLARYLAQIAGRPFELADRAATGRQSIHVGPSAAARRLGIDVERLAPDEWRLLSSSEGLVVAGGRPGGTLDAVHRLLEDRLDVRWWTPFEVDVPARPGATIPPLDDGGRPAFAVRDMNAIAGSPRFRATARLNGEHSGRGRELGAAERYGPPYFAHTFDLYVPPAEFGATHPEWFALVDGERRPGEAQLCTTDEAMRAVLLERLRASIDRGTREAAAAGLPAPRVYDVSTNDVDGHCECEPCRALDERHGGPSGSTMTLVAWLASQIARTHPGVRVSTLAYNHTAEPPHGVDLPSNVVIRYSDLQARDFLRPLRHPANRVARERFERWRALAPTLRVWGYSVTFGSGRGLPLPNLPALVDDLRLYEAAGVEEVFLQFDHPDVSDMRDLKGWVIPRLLERPDRDLDELVVEFTDGYYRAAGPAIRRAMRFVERAALSHDGAIRYPARRSQFGFLDGETIRRVQREFDRAERAVRADAALVERVRRARMSIDRATLARRKALAGDGRSWASRGAGLELDRVARRLHEAWSKRIDTRVPAADRPAARRRMERELSRWIDEVDDDAR